MVAKFLYFYVMLIEKEDYQNCYVTLVWSKKFVTGRYKLGGEIKKTENSVK